jgi:hypothetical protein
LRLVYGWAGSAGRQRLAVVEPLAEAAGIEIERWVDVGDRPDL